ncbi:MAG: selenium metabolism membrane protein YedE/FdhT [Thermincola ferriacetica]
MEMFQVKETGWSRFYRRAFRDHWHPMTAVLVLGVLSALYFGLLQTVWAVTGEFTRWGGHILQLLGYDTANMSYFKIIKLKGLPWDRVDGWVLFGMFGGALIAALLAGNFKLRVPVQRRRLVQGLLGGIIAGFGTRLAMGCNLAAMFTGIPQFTLHAWLFTLATIAGTYFGLKVSLMPFFLGKPVILPGRRVVAAETVKSRQPVIGWFLAAVALGWAVLAWQAGNGKLALAGLFGLAFGAVIERGQICFTSAFRDLWLVGRATVTKAIVAGMAVQSLGTLYFIMQGVPAKVMWAGAGAVIGGLLFGFGIVIAGGCETGWMYRAMEGQVNFWIVGLGNIIGATVLAVAWDKGLYALLVAPYPKVDLIKILGPWGALAATFVFLGLIYTWARWREKRHKYALELRLPVEVNTTAVSDNQ